MFWLELCILLACIFVGARLGGIALGTVAGIRTRGLRLYLRSAAGSAARTRPWHDHRRDSGIGRDAGRGWSRLSGGVS
jgi:hypothetical protein